MARDGRGAAALVALGAAALAGALGTPALACTDPVPPSTRWRTTLDAQYDPFVVTTRPLPAWAKFTIRTCDPTQVVFQDSRAYPLHHGFLSAEVPPFVGMTRQELDAVTLLAAGQQAVLGVVLVGRGDDPNFPDVGIQLVRRDPYTREEALQALEAVRASVILANRFFYFPTAEQRPAAEAESAWFEQQGFEVSSPERWARGGQAYSTGWAVGRLAYFSTASIEAAWASGALRPGDILLTDDVPAEVPPVAGILALRAATPASHVAILAQTWKAPFAWIVGDDAVRAQSLVGGRVVVRVRQDEVKLIAVDGFVDDVAVAELLAMKAPQPLALQPIAALGALAASTDDLGAGDVRHFGGKAANFGFLRRSIPDDAPRAAAFSFDAWTALLDQVGPGGRTLRQDIALRLLPHSWPPADMATLLQDLAAVRSQVKDPVQAPWPPGLDAALIATLQDPQHGFDPSRNIRFRSSTNVEDADDFTGAGLYESFSGCLLDDLDADGVGPSACDPSEVDERGVLRAIRKVFASFYQDNAYLERLRHGVDESQVGMALLVHHSFPDAMERANGVVILDPAVTYRQVVITSQAGAVSVTNPLPGPAPEIMQGSIFPVPGLRFEIQQGSSLLLLGETVLRWPDDYEELHRLATAVHARMVLEGFPAQRRLEFEFKALEPDGRLEIKQVRALPAAGAGRVDPFLLNEPVTWCTEQRANDLFATHRLHGQVHVSTRSARLTPDVLAAGFVTELGHDYLDGCRMRSQSGPVMERPGFAHVMEAGWNSRVSINSWVQPDLTNPRRIELVFPWIPLDVAEDDPILVLSDLERGELRAEHARPVKVETEWGEYAAGEAVAVAPCRAFNPAQQLETRVVLSGGVEVTSTFQWDASGYGPCAHCQTPLVRFVRTEVRGLTTSPFVLTAPEAQAYRTEGHDWGQWLLLEPALDPGVPAATVAELDALGIRALTVLGMNRDVSDVILIHGDEVWGAPRCMTCASDLDGDGRCGGAAGTDCDDGAVSHWATPAEVGSLRFTSPQDLAWPVLLESGGFDSTYDVLRARDPVSLATSPTCLATGLRSALLADAENPGPGSGFYYLVRAINGCPNGLGPLGSDSAGRPRTAPPCP